MARSAHVEANGGDDDLLVGLQLTHSGRYSFERRSLPSTIRCLDPRTVIDKTTGRPPGPTFRSFPTPSSTSCKTAMSTRLCMAARAGFDFVDLKQCHRYLLNELLAARLRNGKYGGLIREPDEVHPRGCYPHPRELAPGSSWRRG